MPSNEARRRRNKGPAEWPVREAGLHTPSFARICIVFGQRVAASDAIAPVLTAALVVENPAFVGVTSDPELI
jgi:hypothetical protein